jgi:hypothetical protein
MFRILRRSTSVPVSSRVRSVRVDAFLWTTVFIKELREYIRVETLQYHRVQLMHHVDSDLFCAKSSSEYIAGKTEWRREVKCPFP